VLRIPATLQSERLFLSTHEDEMLVLRSWEARRHRLLEGSASGDVAACGTTRHRSSPRQCLVGCSVLFVSPPGAVEADMCRG
jgi:hypothetical protein